MKRLFYLFLTSFMAVSCVTQSGKKAEHVFLIAFDGWGAYCMDSVEMPNVRSLMSSGSYTLHKRTVRPSDSTPNWASMFMGAPTEFHGWAENDDTTRVKPVYLNEHGLFPTVFYVLRQQQPESKIGCIYEWGGIRPLVGAESFDLCLQEHPSKIADQAVKYIKAEKPNLMAVIYDDPDHVGHSAGHDTPAYYARMEELDACLGEIIAAVKEAGIYDDSIFIITSDHGGIGRGHGGDTVMEMDTPFIISGKNVKAAGEFSQTMMQQDVAATIAEIFGLNVPDVWHSKSMSQVFEK